MARLKLFELCLQRHNRCVRLSARRPGGCPKVCQFCLSRLHGKLDPNQQYAVAKTYQVHIS